MAYTDKDTIQKYLTVDINSSFDSQITSWIASVKAWIDRYTGKTFEASSQTRYYDTDGCDELFIDSFVGTPTVEILNADGSNFDTLTEGAGNDFVAYPLNTTEKNRIVLTSSKFPRGKRRLKVTATFGFATTVPDDIKLVATKLMGFILAKGIDGGKLSSTQLGDANVSFESIDEAAEALGVFQTLDMYRDISI